MAATAVVAVDSEATRPRRCDRAQMCLGCRAFDRAIVSAALRRDIAGSRSAPLERSAGFAYAAGCNDLASETFLFRRKHDVSDITMFEITVTKIQLLGDGNEPFRPQQGSFGHGRAGQGASRRRRILRHHQEAV